MVIDWLILFRLSAAMDRNSARWLADKWAAAGRPEMTGSEWDNLVKKVGAMAEREAIRE